MSLQRSKSAPHGVSALLVPTYGGLVRVTSFHTIEQVVKDAKVERLPTVVDQEKEDEREDAFNLSSFFPRENKWRAGWARNEEKGKLEEGSLFGISDQMTREAIKGEDKMGVLSLSTLLRRLGVAADDDDGGNGNGEEDEDEGEGLKARMRRVSQVLDEEMVWQRYQARKTGGADDGGPAPFGHREQPRDKTPTLLVELS
ncbi:hypothetical protein H0H87_009181 [Tephrocybe sp. NHM501043]|nr:hypothetical protein H0H87_009181 [Tephrocybe sp. NHM501043]